MDNDFMDTFHEKFEAYLNALWESNPNKERPLEFEELEIRIVDFVTGRDGNSRVHFIDNKLVFDRIMEYIQTKHKLHSMQYQLDIINEFDRRSKEKSDKNRAHVKTDSVGLIRRFSENNDLTWVKKIDPTKILHTRRITALFSETL